MQRGGGGTDVRTLVHQLGGQAHRDVLRQSHRIERQRCGVQLRRGGAEVGRQPVAGGGELGAQWRQGCLGGGQLSAYGQRVRQRLGADLLLRAGDVQRLALPVDDLLGGADLLAQRGFLQRGGDHVAGQGEVGGVELRLLV